MTAPAGLTGPEAAPRAARPTPAPPWGSRRAALVSMAGAVAAGVLLYLSFAPRSWWWAAPVGLALLFLTLEGRSARAGLGLGLLAGLGMMLPLLWWTGEFVGPIGSLPLGILQALLVAPATAGIAAISRTRGAPVWAALLWVAGETFRSVVPFGGFPWGKLAFGQVDGVLLPLATLGGTPLVSFAVALCGFSAAVLIRVVLQAGRRRPGRRPVAAAALAAVGVSAPLVAGALSQSLVEVAPEEGEVTVAAVQGDVPRAGLDFNAERRAVLDNHVRQTLRLAADVEAGRVEQPDVVVWPENSSDIDPFTNPDAFRRIQRAAEAVGVPILVGAVVGGDTPAPRNTVLLWDPQDGPVAEYAKRRLQPFGETMPMRDFFRIFSSQVDRAGRFVPGKDAGTLSVGSARFAITMCYEVIFDDTVRESITNGANLLTVPSNNATFGYTDMTYQQLAIDRFRAVEHGRSVVVPTTSGVSAVIAPDSRVLAQSGMFEPATLVETVPLRSSLTISDRLGRLPELLMTAVGTGAWLAAAFARARARARRPA